MRRKSRVGEERSGSRRGRTPMRPNASTSRRRREGRRRLRGGASGADRWLRGHLKKRGAPHRTARQANMQQSRATDRTFEGRPPCIRGSSPREGPPRYQPRILHRNVRGTFEYQCARGSRGTYRGTKQRTYRAVHPRVVVWHIEETYCCGASKRRTATLSRYTR
jgi:hypothetical protein